MGGGKYKVQYTITLQIYMTLYTNMYSINIARLYNFLFWYKYPYCQVVRFLILVYTSISSKQTNPHDTCTMNIDL